MLLPAFCVVVRTNSFLASVPTAAVAPESWFAEEDKALVQIRLKTNAPPAVATHHADNVFDKHSLYGVDPAVR